MKKKPTKIIIIITALFSSALFVTPGQAINQLSISPASIYIENIKSGTSYSTPLIISTSKDYSASLLQIDLLKNNEMNNWVSLGNTDYKYDEKNENQKILLIINIPPNTKTGVYKNYLLISLDSQTNTNKTVFDVNQTIAQVIPMEITITDKDVKLIEPKWIVSTNGISKNRLPGFDLPGKITLVMDVKNKGNTPNSFKKIIVKIRPINSPDIIATVEYKNFDTCPAFAEKKYFIDLPTYLEPGKYNLEITTYNHNQYKPIDTQTINTQIQESTDIKDNLKILIKFNFYKIISYLTLFLILVVFIIKTARHIKK